MTTWKKILIVFTLLFLVFPTLASAEQNKPFGGLIVKKIYCNCSWNWIITLQTPRSDLPRSLSFDFGSILYQFYKMKVGEYVLGTWEDASRCMVITSHGCRPKIVDGGVLFPRIYMVGTSGGRDETGGGEEPKPQCSDGIDNDGDGKIDYPNDPGCDSREDNSESDPLPPDCSDGIDNDGDGKIDYPDDDGCKSATDTSESNDPCACACADGKSEEETRAKLQAGGVQINKAACPRADDSDSCRSTPTGTGSSGKSKYSCTDVRCLPQVAVDGVIELKEKSGCAVTITGGTEPGHQTHRQCRAIVDLRMQRSGETLTGCVDKYIVDNSITPKTKVNSGYQYILNLVVGRTRFIDERIDGNDPHWHVIFDGGRPAPAPKCLMKQYIIANEGWKNKGYNDPKGKLTIGVGHLVKPGDPYRYGEAISDDEVGNLFEQDFTVHYGEARNLAAGNGVVFENLTEGRQIVIADMTFNMRGSVNGFEKMWAAIRAEDWAKAGFEITDSDYGREDAPQRAARNRRMMETGTTDVAQDQVKGVEKARNYDCGA